MEFIAPNSLQDALKVRAAKPDFKVLAGGTDLCVQLNAKQVKPNGLISLNGVGELSGINENIDSISIGAMTTHAAIWQNDLVNEFLPALVMACRSVGARQIQNVGTIGGNVANASPAGDTLPVLLAHDATVEVASVRGSRKLNFAELFTGYRKLAIAPDEIITRFNISKSVKGERSSFMKLGARRAQAISKVMGCFRAQLDGKAMMNVAVAFGSVGPTPVRFAKTEMFLKSRKFTLSAIDEACELAKSEFEPIDDIRSTADYRRHIVSVMLRRFLVSL